MKSVVLKIDGMTCSACSQGLEKYLQKQKGIIEASVNLILSTATIKYEMISIKEIEKYIEKAGFNSGGEFIGIENDCQLENIKWLIIMGVLLIILMCVSMGPMIGLFEISLFSHRNTINYGLFLLMMAILFIVYGFDILKSGIKNFFHKMPNMDTLVLLSVSASFLYSLYTLIGIMFFNFQESAVFYFESVCMVIYFVKLGRFIEVKSRHKTRDAIRKLVEITPKDAIVIKNGEEKRVALDEVSVGDHIICCSGDKIATDGVVVKGHSYVDESFITGESMPVLKEKGSLVIAGSICYDGLLEIEVQSVGRDSRISEIVKLVIQATNDKSRMKNIVARISGYFVYAIIIIALITIFYHLGKGTPLAEGINYFASVLVVACPCALGLAVPLVSVVSNGVCAKKGLFIRNSEVFERTRNIDTVIFDKTGTLTFGKLKIFKLYNYSSYSDKSLLNLVGNIESNANHPIKTAFKITKRLEVNHFENIVGVGVKAFVNDQKYFLGNVKILKEAKVFNDKQDDYDNLIADGCTIIYVLENDKIIGLIGIKDVVREESFLVIDKLKRQKIDVLLLSGDNVETANLIAQQLKIPKDKVMADVLPNEKAEIITSLIKKGHQVMMVGDGVNDALSLVKATVGVSVNDGCDIAMDAADVILMNNNMQNIVDLLEISKQSYRVICQNLFWTFLYNECMIPVAMGFFKDFGLTINPMIASIMMTFSSLTVVINSLRLGRMK